MQVGHIRDDLDAIRASRDWLISSMSTIRGSVAFAPRADESTHYGYLAAGICRASFPEDGREFSFGAGSFFSLAGDPTFELEDGELWFVSRAGFFGPCVVGTVEPFGRVSYIDGAQASTLVAPQRRGDPTLQALYLPPGVVQTAHTHPSARFGLVIAGNLAVAGDDVEHELSAGSTFVLDPHERHHFKTTLGAGAAIVAYHPDSDFGPTDEDHPMLNRTLIR